MEPKILGDEENMSTRVDSSAQVTPILKKNKKNGWVVTFSIERALII